jgi:hypothetical protein
MKTHLAVIGADPGGYVAAFRQAQPNPLHPQHGAHHHG